MGLPQQAQGTVVMSLESNCSRCAFHHALRQRSEQKRGCAWFLLDATGCPHCSHREVGCSGTALHRCQNDLIVFLGNPTRVDIWLKDRPLAFKRRISCCCELVMVRLPSVYLHPVQDKQRRQSVVKMVSRSAE